LVCQEIPEADGFLLFIIVNKPDVEVISPENTVNACASNVRPDEEETQDKELDHLMNNALDIFSVSSEMKQRKGKDTCLS
jgi:hypothetical protein